MALSIALLSVAALGAARQGAAGRMQLSRDAQDAHDARDSKTLAAFNTMYGVDGPFVGEAFPIRDIPGDELPWTVREARGRLDSDGHLTIQVRGLVFTDDPEVPPDLRGKNDEAQFRGAVSCLTEEGDAVVTKNVITQGFAATSSGNSTIRATVTLPNPCVAPIIMVLAGSEDKWFAVAGFEAEEGGDDGE
jgi:hypothetical protein